MRKNRMRKGRKILFVVSVLVLAMVISAAGVYADSDTVTVKVEGLYGQTEARTMLKMINDFRTGKYVDGGKSQPWALDSSGNIDYVSYAGLGELQYDYELEKGAMQRAIEIAFHFDHERPDGNSCYTAFPSGYNYRGENIAAGYRSAKSAFDGWCETDDDYSGQGHRRNMLNKGFNRIGIAKVTVDGVTFWVQNFGNKSGNEGLAPVAAADTVSQKTMDLERSYILDSDITVESESMTLEYGESKAVPEAVVRLRTGETWPARKVAIAEGYIMASKNSSIASVSGGLIKGEAIGKTSIEYTSVIDPSEKATLQVTVEPISISSAVVEVPDAGYIYSAGAHTPMPTVKLNGAILSANTDYEVSYDNNTNAGKADVIVTGKGIYKGTAKGSFVIAPRPLSDGVTIKNAYAVETYNGKAHTPDGTTLEFSGTPLKKGTDYTVKYSDNVEPGTAKVTIKGIGNFTGETTATFTIRKSGSDPKQKGSDGTALGEGASATAAEQAITGMKNDNDPAGSKHGLLQLKSTKQGNSNIQLNWKKVKKAKKYVIYGNACGKKNKMKKLKTLSKNSFNMKKLAGKKLKKGTYHKFLVVALDKNNNVVSSSKVIHVATKGGKVGNYKSITVKAKVDAKGKAIKKLKPLSKTQIKKGKKVTLKATANPADKKLKVKKHVAIRYESANPKIAKVNKKGVVTGVKKGKTKIFVYAQNGVTKAVTITVK